MLVFWRSLPDLAGLSPPGRSNSVTSSSWPFSPPSSPPVFGTAFPARPPGPSRETPAPNAVFDYVLYLGSLVWCVELAYLENRFHVLSGQWDLYLLATAVFFFFLAYRFDNRFVLSLALSSLAGWFGLTISHWPSHQDAAYRAICASLLPDGRRRRSASSAPRPETAFLRHVSEHRGQRSLLGIALRRVQSGRLRRMVSRLCFSPVARLSPGA